jgi:hypothetical protein
MDYPVKPDNDREEDNHARFFTLIQLALPFIPSHVATSYLSFYPLDSTMSLINKQYKPLSFTQLNSLAHLFIGIID